MNIAAMWLGLPKWVRDAIMIFGAILAVIFLGRQYVRGKVDEAVSADRERQINSQRQETAERVQDFNEASRAIEHLPEHELREQTEADPHNRGRVYRDGGAGLPLQEQ
jgi:hypothetical protein